MSEPSTSRRDRNLAVVRARIVAAGKALIAEGACDVTVAAIAERADVAVATFYNHFDSRDAFVEEIETAQIDATARAVADIFAAAEAPHFALAMLTKVMTISAAQVPEELKFALHVADDLIPEVNPIDLLVRGVIDQGIASGVMSDALDPALAAAMYRTAVKGAIGSSMASNAGEILWKEIVYPSLRMLGVDRDDITDAVSVAHAWAPSSAVVTGEPND
jgi:AcrR family transcriptional regulator